MRDYAAAVTALNTLQSNASVLDAIRKSGKALNKDAMPEMREWCRRIGYEPEEFNKLNIIHIAGTKGKGSTSAFVSSILSQYIGHERTAPPSSSNTVSAANIQQSTLHKIGLYTSPHLRFVRERIQINNEPLTEEQFARYFFEIWDRLETSAQRHHNASTSESLGPATTTSPRGATDPTKPVYFRYLTLMAFHVYLSEGIDTAIIECGIGGEYDSTNVISAPTVAAVTSLGIDHTHVLGNTIDEIAWHKAGIFKESSRTRQVYTVADQPPSAMSVLRRRAEAVDLQLCEVPRHPDIASGKVELGLAADFQKTNASLAVAVAAAHLRHLGFQDIPHPLSQESLPEKFIQGLASTRWGGRCEVRKERNITWHIDGGHTLESLRLGAQWYASCLLARGHSKQKRVLLFNQQTRDAHALARALHEALAKALRPVAASDEGQSQDKNRPIFEDAIFSTNITYSPSPMTSPTIAAVDRPSQSSTTAPSKKSGKYKADLMSMYSPSTDVSRLEVQTELAKVWKLLDHDTEVMVTSTLEEAIANIRADAEASVFRDSGMHDAGGGEDSEVMVLVTGSLHLVGGVLEVLETSKDNFQ